MEFCWSAAVGTLRRRGFLGIFDFEMVGMIDLCPRAHNWKKLVCMHHLPHPSDNRMQLMHLCSMREHYCSVVLSIVCYHCRDTSTKIKPRPWRVLATRCWRRLHRGRSRSSTAPQAQEKRTPSWGSSRTYSPGYVLRGKQFFFVFLDTVANAQNCCTPQIWHQSLCLPGILTRSPRTFSLSCVHIPTEVAWYCAAESLNVFFFFPQESGWHEA